MGHRCALLNVSATEAPTGMGNVHGEYVASRTIPPEVICEAIDSMQAVLSCMAKGSVIYDVGVHGDVSGI